MQIEDICNLALDAIEQGKVTSSAGLYADDFTFTGPVPMPLNKNQFLDMMTKVTSGVPNWSFNRHDMHVEGDTVVIPVRVSGTQSHTLPSLMPGMPNLPATNRSFRNPPEEIHVRFKGDKVAEIHVDPVPGGGIPGMLEQLGMPVPVTGQSNKPKP